RSGLATESEARTHLQCSEEDLDAGREPDGVCNSGGGDGDGDGDGDGGSDSSLCLPMDPTGQLCAEQLCAIPSLGPAFVEAAGGACPSEEGGEASPIDIEQLCAIPGLGPSIAEGLGGSC
ncbi:MAG: hypothetical protein R3352_07975, partial [Salinisphaeraceae bacterium]|nr:hypothetical protein [Salinisphaeraceae bacterium]